MCTDLHYHYPVDRVLPKLDDPAIQEQTAETFRIGYRLFHNHLGRLVSPFRGTWFYGGFGDVRGRIVYGKRPWFPIGVEVECEDNLGFHVFDYPTGPEHILKTCRSGSIPWQINEFNCEIWRVCGIQIHGTGEHLETNLPAFTCNRLIVLDRYDA